MSVHYELWHPFVTNEYQYERLSIKILISNVQVRLFPVKKWKSNLIPMVMSEFEPLIILLTTTH